MTPQEICVLAGAVLALVCYSELGRWPPSRIPADLLVGLGAFGLVISLLALISALLSI